jgi:hypothetical protein
MFKTKEEKTIAEIHESLKIMGFGTSLENLAKMKPTELKKFYKKACKAFELYCSVERILYQLSAEENSAPIPRDE